MMEGDIGSLDAARRAFVVCRFHVLNGTITLRFREPQRACNFRITLLAIRDEPRKP